MDTINVAVPQGLDARTAQHFVERILEHQGLLVRVATALADETTPIGPGVLAQVGRIDRLWRDIENRWGLLTRAQATEVTGGNPDKAKSHVMNLRRRHGLLGVIRGGSLRFPGFQFTDHGVRDGWRTLVSPLLVAGWAEEDVLLWFAAPTGQLGGSVPADLLDTAPDAVSDAVTEVAKGSDW